MSELQSNIQQANQWARQSVTLKLTIITVLTILLLIPASMIDSIIHERNRLNQETVHKVNSDWAGNQHITGPILSVPLVYKHGSEQLLHILPETLTIDGSLTSDFLKRGIYKIIVYESSLNIKGSFKPTADIDTSKIDRIAWDRAFITMGITDLRGVQDEMKINWGGQGANFLPATKIPKIIASGITADVPVSPDITIPFDLNLNIQGSQGISFIPVGNTTNVTLTSNWPTPSFQGSFLPDDRNLTDNSFNAQWKVLQLNRNYPSSWVGLEQVYNLHESAFGVDLLVPLDNYQKNIRMAKYAILIIALTFLAFFLVEILNGKRIHPFQYTLVGLALLLFYILLLSISEHSNFEIAYVISSLGIVVMITLYSVALFKSPKLTVWMTTSLSLIYGFMFVILQLADYALLIGSIGLFMILAATMYFTRNINWYKVQATKSKT